MLFGTIIEINQTGDVLLNKKQVHLVPEFEAVYKDKNLGGTMIKYLVCVYDDSSPYRRLPLEVRKEDVSLKLYGKKKPPYLNSPKVAKAIRIYEYLQYDPIRDQYDALVQKNKEKIEIFNSIEVTKENIVEMNTIEEKMLKTGSKLREMKKELEIHEEEKKMQGSTQNELSFIEEQLIRYRQENP